MAPILNPAIDVVSEIKVTPGSAHEDALSIVGGLAEPARGHRTNRASVPSICSLSFITSIILGTLLNS
ncbi:hypothetical protein GWI33_017186 [Rhynchophorus ferrugineus]|uniref:Uncharacterized protein n=1 Tax=Rhynchophorus ferrugineus TaxID=354439 RepID=A0A834HZK8_RHYFE|nr:hypothetical protein GWI33_017186 [Rhynchophorus ferrugineus]